MSKSVIIVGGGIIGLCTAYYLQKEGCEVTVIDKSDFSSGASYVNAGYITPSHFIPLSQPGIIAKGLKWMFNPESPFYVKPRLDAEFLEWAWAFKKSSTKFKVEKAIPILKDFNILSRELYAEMKASSDFDFHYEKKGLLMFYKSDKVGEEEWNVGQRGIKEGLKVEHLSASAVKKLEPNVELDIKGAVYFHSDAHMTPNAFMKDMYAYLKTKGIKFCPNEAVVDVELSNNSVSKIITHKQELKADEVVLAAGSWSQNISKKLGIKIPLQAGKGYSINVEKNTGITMPSILCEAKVAVTPMDGFTRFAGTMEIAGINHNINSVRVNAIVKATKNYYPNLEILKSETDHAKCGLRPCSPDGMPYIGKSSKCKNLTIATGHAMMGWSLGPATGKLISQTLLNQQLAMSIDAFHPDRKF